MTDQNKPEPQSPTPPPGEIPVPDEQELLNRIFSSGD